MIGGVLPGALLALEPMRVDGARCKIVYAFRVMLVGTASGGMNGRITTKNT